MSRAALRWNRAQRVVLVVAFGIVIATITLALTHQWDHYRGGWFAYAPNTGVLFDDGSSTWPIWRDALTWLAGAAVWCAVALYLLRSAAVDDSGAAIAPPLTRREVGMALGWVAVAAQVVLGVLLGWLWWPVAAMTAAGLVLSRRADADRDEEP